MSRMYLVRRENNRFIGPVTLSGFRERLKKMEFGVQDEVSSHCMPWVILDKEALIRKYYPELAEVISTEMPAAWREMTGHAKIVTKSEHRLRLEKKSERPSRGKANQRLRSSGDNYYKSKPSVAPKIFALLMIAAVGAAGWFVTQKGKDDVQVGIGDFTNLASQSDPNRFLNEMGLKLVPIVSRINKGKDEKGSWLPYLRMYAFYTSGSIENLPVKTLRGAVPLFAPQDCSVETWKKRWTDNKSQVAAWMSGGQMSKNVWTKTLSWDPHWIKRRTSVGWMKPRNWFEGCLMTASVAIKSVTEELATQSKNTQKSPDIELLVVVHRRLLLQIDIIQKGRTIVPVDPSSTVGVLSCMEQASTLKDLGTCQLKTVDLSLQQMFDDHYAQQVVRLASLSANLSDSDFQAEWMQLALSIQNEDSLSKLDYGPEIKFMQDLQTNGFKADGLSNKVSTEFGDVSLY
jgi:hypothetical protein